MYDCIFASLELAIFHLSLHLHLFPPSGYGLGASLKRVVVRPCMRVLNVRHTQRLTPTTILSSFLTCLMVGTRADNSDQPGYTKHWKLRTFDDNGDGSAYENFDNWRFKVENTLVEHATWPPGLEPIITGADTRSAGWGRDRGRFW